MGKRTVEAVLAGGYVHHLGAHEVSISAKQPQTKDALLIASQRLGKICRRAEPGELRDLTAEPSEIVHALIEDEDTSSETKYQAKMLGLGIKLAEKSYLNRSTGRIRGELQTETAFQLNALVGKLACKQYQKHHSDYLGYLAELTTVGLINYSRSNNYMALLAPPHHDFSHPRFKHKNYDAIFIYSKNSRSHSQALQVKAGCQKFCENPISKSHHRGHYGSNIAMISGHCDLDTYRTRNGSYVLDVPNLLIRATLTPETMDTAEHAQLDAVSSRLVETIINDGRGERAGTATEGQRHAA